MKEGLPFAGDDVGLSIQNGSELGSRWGRISFRHSDDIPEASYARISVEIPSRHRGISDRVCRVHLVGGDRLQSRGTL